MQRTKPSLNKNRGVGSGRPGHLEPALHENKGLKCSAGRVNFE